MKRKKIIHNSKYDISYLTLSMLEPLEEDWKFTRDEIRRCVYKLIGLGWFSAVRPEGKLYLSKKLCKQMFNFDSEYIMMGLLEESVTITCLAGVKLQVIECLNVPEQWICISCPANPNASGQDITRISKEFIIPKKVYGVIQTGVCGDIPD